MVTGRLQLLILSAVLAATASASGQSSDAKIRVDGAWARRAPMMESSDAKAGSGNSAVYATLVNPRNEPDALISAATDVAEAVEIHESYQESGMMMMRPVKKIDIPAGRKVEMKPGGYHIMLLNLKRDLKPKEVVSLTLMFEKAGKIPVNAPVR